MTCLWAVQLQLLHPISRQPLDLSVEAQAAKEYERICSVEAVAIDGARVAAAVAMIGTPGMLPGSATRS
jgi:hypothetical protein